MTASSEMPTAQATVADPALSPPGLRSGFRLLLQHLGDHLDLLRLETGQELARFGAVLGCWFALALFLQMGLMMGLTLLVASYWDSEYRTHTIILSGAVLLGGVLYCLWQMKRLGKNAAHRFSASSQQWQRDLKLIQELI